MSRNGSLEPIGLLFSEIAGQPVPPHMLIELLDIVRSSSFCHDNTFPTMLAEALLVLCTDGCLCVQPEEQMKAAMEKKEHPVATKEQLSECNVFST